MKYNSTRNSNLKVESAVAIKQGLSVEGGLFVPESFPELSMDDIKKLAKASYVERATFILKKFLTDYLVKEVKACATKAYSRSKFGVKVAPLVKLSDTEFVLELWHGPTCAFKDMALQILPHLLTTAMKKTGEEKTVVILVATSGDTGKAALEGFKDVDGTKIMVFYPSDGVSDIQKLQMITQEGRNVCVSGIQGNFDDAQNGVKAIFTDEKAKAALLKKNYVLSSANSINWGRLAPQIVYYVSAYCDMVNTGEIQIGDKINICVPTGNFGNILAAYYAKKMGLPVNKLICASNCNNILTEFMQTGVYDRNREFHTTISPSMDILISSNLERLLYDLSGCDDEVVNALMNELRENGKYTVSDDIFGQIKELFWAGCCDDYFTKVQIYNTNNQHGYTVDTHTAVAVDVYKQYKEQTGDNTKTVIASTASPYKFNASVISALGRDEEMAGKDDFELLELLSEVSGTKIPKSLKSLKNKEKRFENVCDKTKMLDAVNKFLK
ncbi:MAG: threonine synthase [Ruminococcaceae bacterium]|nr:threonine synthase [Oscillospiraceae bacterium]